MTLPYETQREIELFLLREAKLLDTGEFEAWLALYAPDGIYWMPSQPGQTDAEECRFDHLRGLRHPRHPGPASA